MFAAWGGMMVLRRFGPWLLLVLGVAALGWAVWHRGYDAGRVHERPIAYAAGQRAQDKVWLDGQAKAAAAHHAWAKGIEARQAAVTNQVGDRHAHDVADLHDAYGRMRRARAGGAGAAGRADLPGVSDAAGGVAQSGGPDVVVSDSAGAYRAGPPRLIIDADIDRVLSLLEEGDVYRLRVQAWVDWYAGVAAVSAPAVGGGKPPD